MAAGTAVCVVKALLMPDLTWITGFDALNRHVYGFCLLLALVLGVGRLILVASTRHTPWRRNQYRWLLLCLGIGAAPYALLEKLPTLWGRPPLILPDLAMAMLLITLLSLGVTWLIQEAQMQSLRLVMAVMSIYGLSCLGFMKPWDSPNGASGSRYSVEMSPSMTTSASAGTRRSTVLQ